jgi:hypothetical protein
MVRAFLAFCSALLWAPALALAQTQPSPRTTPQPVQATGGGGAWVWWLIVALIVLAVIWWAVGSSRRRTT